jgi:hypothetical protein
MSAVPNTEALQREGQEVATRAAAVMIASHEEYALAGEELVRVATLRKSIQAAFKEPKDKANQAHKAITSLEAKLLEFPAKAEALLKQRMGEFQLRDEATRIQAQQRKEEEDRRIAEAQLLEGAGHTEAAEALLEEPVPMPVVEIPKARAEGVSVRKKFGFRIIDPSKINPAFLMVDEAKIRKQVAALGADAASLIGAGVEIFEESVVSVRTPGKVAA